MPTQSRGHGTRQFAGGGPVVFRSRLRQKAGAAAGGPPSGEGGYLKGRSPRRIPRPFPRLGFLPPDLPKTLLVKEGPGEARYLVLPPDFGVRLPGRELGEVAGTGAKLTPRSFG